MATAKPRAKIGHMACLCCGEKIPVKQADTGTLNLSCPECDFTGYVKPHTDAHRNVSRRVTLLAPPVLAPAEPKPAAETKPAAPVARAAKPAQHEPTQRRGIFTP